MRKTFAALIGTATVTTVLSGAGLAAASARPAAAHLASSGTERIYLMTTSGTSGKYTAIATGVFTAGGVDISGNTTDTLKFPGGTFKVRHTGAPHGKQALNPKTCLFTANLTASYTISAGTGSYAGISGSGKAALRILGVMARNSKGKCSETLPPKAWEQTITGKGHVKL